MPISHVSLLSHITHGDLSLLMDQRIVDRLSKKCFRDPQNPRAGTFHAWHDHYQALHALKHQLRETIIAELDEAPSAFDGISCSVECVFPFPVGWSSTADIKDIPLEDLELFKPNARSIAMRVRLGSKHLARQTNIATVIMNIQRSHYGKGFTVFVNSMYPGKDIGDLEGNITQREGQVFFGWEHPGEPIEDRAHQNA